LLGLFTVLRARAHPEGGGAGHTTTQCHNVTRTNGRIAQTSTSATTTHTVTDNPAERRDRVDDY